MKKVICSGTLNENYHQCEARNCKHRKLHESDKCTCRDHNGENRWCDAPGTVSPLDGNEDGGLVTCMTQKELDKEEMDDLRYLLNSAIKNRDKCDENISKSIKDYVDACKSVSDIKKCIMTKGNK